MVDFDPDATARDLQDALDLPTAAAAYNVATVAPLSTGRGSAVGIWNPQLDDSMVQITDILDVINAYNRWASHLHADGVLLDSAKVDVATGRHFDGKSIVDGPVSPSAENLVAILSHDAKSEDVSETLERFGGHTMVEVRDTNPLCGHRINAYDVIFGRQRAG